MLVPVVELLVEAAGIQPPLLPHRVVAVLDLQLRQLRLPALHKRSIQGAQLTIQHAYRPRVNDDVVQGQQQNVVIGGDPHQAGTEQRPGR